MFFICKEMFLTSMTQTHSPDDKNCSQCVFITVYSCDNLHSYHRDNQKSSDETTSVGSGAGVNRLALRVGIIEVILASLVSKNNKLDLFHGNLGESRNESFTVYITRCHWYQPGAGP